MIQVFRFAVDVTQALLWKHNRARRLEALALAKQSWLDQQHAGFWSAWLRDVFDLRTANDFGTAIWARILGVRLALPLSGSHPDKATWGFGPSRRNFERGNFGRIGNSTSRLTTEERRLVLRMRYFQLVGRCTIPDINHALRTVFGEGRAYVLDPLNMEFITYVFTYNPGQRLLDVLLDTGVLPRPSTVGVRVVVSGKRSFGFGPHALNFTRGGFGE